MGIAGGLVPSPSALIVLLASIGLGRTAFGVSLVFAYGLGMASTLSAVGLVLVRIRTRLEYRSRSQLRQPSTIRNVAATIATALPVLTAVLVVGLVLARRGVLSPS